MSTPPSDDAQSPRDPAGTALTAPRQLALRSGRQIEIGGEGGDGGDEWITVRDPSGRHLVTMRLGDDGPVFSFERGSLEIAAAEDLSLSCETLRVQASGSASIAVGGDLHEQVGGEVIRRSEGALSTTAKSVAIEASPGGIRVEAQGELSLDGERIRLNSEDPPMPISWEEHRARQGQKSG